MTGRGVGRGIGRGTPRTDISTMQSSEVQPVVAPAALPGVGRGRGLISLAVEQPLVAVPVPSGSSRLISQESNTAVIAGIGRGFLGRGRRLASANQGEALVTSEPLSSAQVPGTLFPATDPCSATGTKGKNVEEEMQRLAVGADRMAPRWLRDTSGDPPQAPRDGSRPTDIPQGAEGVLVERKRREAELRSISKPVGTAGRKVNLLGNVVHFEADPMAMVYEYRVDFYPQTWSAPLRAKLIGLIEGQLPGPYLFDFDNLFLAAELPREEQDFIVQSPFHPSSQCKLSVRRVMTNRANESKELLNLIVKELEVAMKFTQIGRNRYNPKNRVALQQGNMPALEIWPGFQTSVNPFAGGVMLMTDPAFRVVRVGNVKMLIDQWRKANPKDDIFQKMIRDNLVGSTVLTPYNDKSYVVSEVAWDKTPMDTFDTREGPITYVEYYKQHHNIDLKDLKQPLMFSKPAPSGLRRRDNRLIALIPELCQLTGIQDDLRANFNAMKAITTTTKLSPAKRFEFIMEYLTAFVQTDVAQALMRNWGIKIGSQLIALPGRALPAEMIQFGSRPPTMVANNGDWTRDATSSAILGNMPLRKWTLIFLSRDQRVAEDFDRMLRDVGRGLGMNVADPNVIGLTSDTSITWINGINTAVKDNKSEMVVLIFPTPRDDRYAAVKKACYVVHGVASQCINQRTLSKPDKMRAIVQKICLQMNCKLGGYLWRMGKFGVPLRPDDEPLKMMVIGIDAYHDLKRQRDSVTAVVASTDEDFTRWHSRCNFQNPKAELGAGLKVSFMSALNSFVKANKALPNTIVIFRDGLSDAELDQAVTHELPQITEVCKDPAVVMELLHSDSSGSESSSSKSEAEYTPEIYFIVVQKRINQRLFLIESVTAGQQSLANPKPGTVVDTVITRRDMYDFYLVPQNVREGSVTPVHFIVVHQPRDPRLSVDQIQNLAYKLTHMYYNWTGTIRVPAPCMYAHKLAYQSGACYDRTEPRIDIADKLYFL